MSLRGIGSSIVSFLRRYIHRPRVEISTANVTAAIALIVITIIGLLIRLLPMLGFEILVRAFDPWYNYREVQFILENGFSAWFGWYDWTTWVPFGRNIPETSYPGIPFTAALMYLAFQAVGIQIDVMTVCVLFPAIFGTFGVIAIYFLGREVASKEVGLFAAFFMAIIPAYTQRTIAGFFDNEAIGILAIILTLFFFIRALRKGSIASAILGGLSLGYLAASWSVYLYIFQVLAIFALIMVLLRRYSRRLLLAYSGTILGGMLIAICVPRIGPDWISSSTGIIPLGVFALLLLIDLSRTYRVTEWSFPTSFSQVSTRLRPYFAYIFGAMCALIVVGLGYLFQSGLIMYLSALTEGLGPFADLGSKFQTVIDPMIRQTAQLLASVGEHLPAPWATFWYNLSFLVLVIPFGFYIAFRREREVDILLLIFALTALYFSGSMIRLALLLAPAAAVIGAYGVMMAIRPFRPIFWQRPILTRRRRRITPTTTRAFASVVYAFLIILLLGATITSFDAVNLMGSPEITPGYRFRQDTQAGSALYRAGDTYFYRDYLETFSWTQHHTPSGSIFISWWDYGYWIRELGDRPCVADNATINKTQIGWVGRMMMETDPVEALKIAARFNAKYVLIHFGKGQNFFSGDEGKWQWMSRISREVFGDEVPPESYFWSDPLKGGNGSYFTPYFQTMIYNWLWYNASDTEFQRAPSGAPQVDPIIEPGRSIFSLFDPVYISSTNLMKIYEVNYTWLESSLEIGGASAYPVNVGQDPIEDLSSIVLEVQNTGQYGYAIDSVGVDYWDYLNNRYETDLFPIDWITSNTGSLWIDPGETIMINVKSQPAFTVGTTINVTVNAKGFTPTLNTTVTIPVEQPPIYDVTPIIAESWIYANGTGRVVLENTGEGYVEIAAEAFSIDDWVAITPEPGKGSLLFTGDQVAYTFEIESQTVGDNITIRFHYMANLQTYKGLNVSAVIQVTPTPAIPSASSSSESNNPQSPVTTLVFRPEFFTDYGVAWSAALFSCCEAISFFIARRYRP